jgi:hypothetical protein
MKAALSASIGIKCMKEQSRMLQHLAVPQPHHNSCRGAATLFVLTYGTPADIRTDSLTKLTSSALSLHHL